MGGGFSLWAQRVEHGKECITYSTDLSQQVASLATIMMSWLCALPVLESQLTGEDTQPGFWHNYQGNYKYPALKLAVLLNALWEQQA